MKMRNSLHGRRNKHQLWSKEKMLLHVGIVEFLMSFPKANQYLPSHFSKNAQLSLSSSTALEKKRLRHQLDATFLKQAFRPTT